MHKPLRIGGMLSFIVLVLCTQAAWGATLTIPQVSAGPGETLPVPILVDDATSIAGAEMVLVYDPALLTPIRAQTTRLTESFSITYVIRTGRIAITLANAQGLEQGSGNLIEVIFTVAPEASDGDTSVLRLEKLALYDEQAAPIPASSIEGTFRTIEVDIEPPQAPSGVSARSGGGYVRLSWSPNAEPDLSHYIIYRSQTQGFTPTPGDSIGAVDQPDTTFTDTGLTNGITYYYRISAVDEAGNESAFSEEVSATPISVGIPAQTWTQLSPTGGPPAKRSGHSSVYNPSTNRMIVFGGCIGANVVAAPSVLNDVWVLKNADGQGGTPVWTQLSPTGPSPSARAYHPAVYDPTTNRMIVFGGNPRVGYCRGTTNDVWVLENADGLEGTPAWHQLSPTSTTGTPPGKRNLHSAVYDPNTNRMMVFGGGDACGPNQNDVWVLEHANGLGGTPNWIQLNPTGGPHDGRVTHSAVYDPVTNRMIAYGNYPPQGDVWVLEHANGLGGSPNWVQLFPEGTGPIRNGHTAIYDASTNRMIVFGGGDTTARKNEVWALNNANGVSGTPTWTQLDPTGASLDGRTDHTAVYNPVTRRMTIYGGSHCSAGCYDLDDVWVLAPDLAVAVPEISLSAASYDFGEVYLGDSTDWRLTVSNVGAAELSVTHIMLDDPVFTVDRTSFSVAPGGRQDVVVTFRPTAEGAVSGTLTITSDDPDEGTLQVSLSGTGADGTPPEAPTGLTASEGDGQVLLTWSPNTEPDLSHYVIYRSQTQGFSSTLTDSVGGVDKPDTTFTDIGLTNGTTYYYRISAVDGVGNRSGFSVEIQAIPSSTVFPQPDIALSATSHNFGNVQVGASSSWTLAVSNLGDATLSVSNITSSDAQFGGSPPSFTLAAGESQNVTVTFTPTSAGSHAATLSVASDDPDEAVVQVSLSGTGADGTPPEAPTGLAASEGDEQTILTWSPNTDPDLSHYVIYRSQTQGFSPTLTDSVGRVDQPDTTFTDIGLTNGVTYYYRISAVDGVGNKSGFSEEIQAIPSATVLPQPDIALSATSHNFGNVQVGASSSWTLAVSNLGDATLSVSNITSSDAQFGGSPPSFTVAAGESQNVTVTFTPTSAGSHAATLSVASSDPDEGVAAVQLAGTGADSPPVISSTPVNAQRIDRDLSLSASVTDAGGVQSVILYYRAGGERWFTSTTMSKASGDTYEATIPGSAVTSRGLEYYVFASDHTGNGATFPEEGQDKPHCVQITFQDCIAEAAYPVGIWKMVGVPVMPDNGSPFEILTALGTYDISRWRLFRFYWGAYHEFTHEDIGNFEPGKAFWLHTRIPDFKFRAGGGGTTPTDAPFEIRLEPGWSDISCPFAFPVRWDDVMAESGDPAGVSGPYTYDGAVWSFPNPTDRLEPWEGYAVKNTNTAALTLNIPPRSAEESAKPFAKPLSDGEWVLRVKVHTPDPGTDNPKSAIRNPQLKRDVNNFLGFRENARTEWDRLDLPEPPPAPGETLSLYFPHEEWAIYPDAYTSDFRPHSDGEVWTFVVEGSLDGGEAVLSFDGLADLPSGLKASLLDADGQVSVDLKKGVIYPVTVGRDRRTFRIVVGSAGYVEQTAGDFQGVPERIVLSPNRPNPFNAETVIAYQLSERGQVRLVVYDLLGREVALLVDTVSDPGYFQAVWDGKDGNGTEVASGVYFCILETLRERVVNKMMMVR